MLGVAHTSRHDLPTTQDATGAYFNGRVSVPKVFGAAVPQALREYIFLCERPLIG